MGTPKDDLNVGKVSSWALSAPGAKHFRKIDLECKIPKDAEQNSIQAPGFKNARSLVCVRKLMFAPPTFLGPLGPPMFWLTWAPLETIHASNPIQCNAMQSTPSRRSDVKPAGATVCDDR